MHSRGTILAVNISDQKGEKKHNIGACRLRGGYGLANNGDAGDWNRQVCHERCAIFAQVGDCVMPREGIFAEVLQCGEIRLGDTLEIIT